MAASADLLEALVKRVHEPGPGTVGRHAVAALFAALRRPGNISEEARTSAISVCLSRPQKAIVQEASEQLSYFALSGGLPASEATELLLQGLTTAGPATAPPLADALCRLIVAAGKDTAGAAGANVSRLGRWSAHPLSAALLCCPAAATQLLTSAMASLAVAATADACAVAADSSAGAAAGVQQPQGAHAQERAWAVLEPFFSFVLLQRQAPVNAAGAGGGPMALSAAAAAATATAPSAVAPAAAAALGALAPWLHAQLVRWSCCAPAALRLRVLRFLAAHLALGPRGSEADRLRAVQCTADVLDVLEAALEDAHGVGTDVGADADVAGPHAHARAAAMLADALLQLAYEVAWGSGGGGSGGGAEVVAALLRLHGLAPGALRMRLAALALLTLSAYGKQLQGLHLLLHRVVSNAPATGVVGDFAGAAMSLPPLLAAVAFGTSSSHGAGGAPAAVWPAHLASQMQALLDALARKHGADGSSSCSVGEPAGVQPHPHAYSDLCLLQQCRQLLLLLWAPAIADAAAAQSTQGAGSQTTAAAAAAAAAPPPCELVRWLCSLELLLRQRRRAAAAGRAVAAQLPFAARVGDAAPAGADTSNDAHPAIACLAAALLAHPSARVRTAAAAAARELVLLLPAVALPLLPLVMHQLRRGSAASVATAGSATAAGSEAAEAAAAQLALLQLLPVMAADAAVAPYALRVLQPLLGAEAPPGLRCVGLKLLCDTWLLTGRGWTHVEAALNGLAPPGARDPPPALRVTRAALVRAVCDRDPGRGVELVAALQQAVRDEAPASNSSSSVSSSGIYLGNASGARGGCPAAAALGLEALGVLAEEDVLDFYAAYGVVHRWHPKLPDHPLVASRWVALLAHGALDAEAYPEKAAAVLDALWAATKHPHAQVRASAYGAISRYPLGGLEKLEVLRPLARYTAPLLTEADADARRQARALAAVALRFEHENRRRLLLSQPVAADASATAAAVEPEASADKGATASGAGAGSGGSGAAFAAAATAREARALRNRVAARVPKLLLTGLGSGAAGAGGSGGGGAAFHPGAVLFCYTRPPAAPPPGASAGAAAAVAKRAAAECQEAYGNRMRDVLRRLSWRGAWFPRLAVQGWSTFVRHWMYDTGLAAADAAAALAAEWDGAPPGAASGAAAGAAPAKGGARSGGGGRGGGGGGGGGGAGGAGGAPVAVLEGIGLAVGALCVCAEDLPEAVVSGLTSRLLLQAQAGSSWGICRSSLLGAAMAATRLHPTDWAARQQVLSELRAQLLAGGSAVARSAAALGLGVLAGSLAADPAIYIRAPHGVGDAASGGAGGAGHSRELLAVAEAVGCLATCLGTLSPALAPAMADLVGAGLPHGWPPPDAWSYGAGGGAAYGTPRPLAAEVDEQEVLPGAAAALAGLLCDVNRAHGLPQGALRRLVAALAGVAAASAAAPRGGGGEDAGAGAGGAAAPAAAVDPGAVGAAVAALEAVAALAPEALRYQQLSAEDVAALLSTARQLYGGGGGGHAAADGRVSGAAAACLGAVAAAAVRHGALPSAASGVGAGANSSSEAAVRNQQAQPPQSPPSSEAAAVATLLTYVGELAEAAGCAGGAARGQHGAAARAGAVAGLAALLLPPPSSLTDALAPVTPDAAATGLLAQPEYVAPAKAAVRALEALATGGDNANTAASGGGGAAAAADPLVAAAAAFHLAAIAAAVAAAEGDDLATATQGGGGGGGGAPGDGGGGEGGVARGAGGGGGPKALSLYPSEGAVRPLVTAVMDRSRAAGLPDGCHAEVLLALAAAPALPLADWAAACRTVLAAQPPAAAASPRTSPEDAALQAQRMRRQAAALLLALAHGAVPSYGLGALLDEQLAPARFAVLAPPLQCLLLARLPAVLRSLGAKRAAATVQALPGLLAAATQGGGGGIGGSAGGTEAAAAAAVATAFPWSSAAGLDEPRLQLTWLQRVRQALGDPCSVREGSGCAMLLAAHAWLGLLGVCRAWQAKDANLAHKDITQAAHTAIAALVALLPPLPPLQPGEGAQLVAWASAAGASASVAAAADAAAPDEWHVYGPAGRQLAVADARDAPMACAGAPCNDGGAVAAPAAAAAAVAVAGLRGSGAETGDAAVARRAVTLWSLAACCLRCCRADFLAAHVLTTAAPQPSGVDGAAPLSPAATAALQLRCVLVASGHVSYRELTPARMAVAAAAVPVPQAGSDCALLLPLCLALSSTPQAFQAQVLLQTLDGARATPHNLGPPLELAAALVATCLCHVSTAAASGSGGGSGNTVAAPSAAPELCVTLSSRAAALACLPYTLPRLLSRPPWSASCEAVAQALLSLARAGVRASAAGRAGASHGAGVHSGGVTAHTAAGAVKPAAAEQGDGPLRVVLACLWALRDTLPAYTYEQVHSALEWRALAGLEAGAGL